ncbi:hypothetical protein V8D89_012512 [Ganoderma adspersum]
MPNPRVNATANPTPAPSRPVTSKARGICAYYNTKYGCYAGDRCKFLHGKDEHLTSYDRSKVCRFHAAGYCKHGDDCWFIHVNPTKPDSSSPKLLADSEEELLCVICYDKPTTYGLLAGCSHVFCLSCIINWRDPEGKSSDIVEAGTTKTCPMCRSPSRFVTPSSLFFSEGDSRKAEAIEKYKKGLASVKCRYFEQSRPEKRFCPFGKECFFKHENVDGTPHVFEHGADYYMRRSRRNENDFAWEHPIQSSFDIAHMRARDVQQAILSSLVAAFGVDILPSSYRLNEEPGQEDATADGSEYEELPHLLQPWDSEETMVNLLSDHAVTDDDAQWDLAVPQPLFAGPPTAPHSPVSVSTAASTLDPESPAFFPSQLDSLRPLPSGPEDAAHLERLFRGLEDQQRAIQENIPSTSGASSSPALLNAPPSLSIDDGAVQDADPPFMTDGRGRVVWSRRSSSLSRVRATPSSAAMLPHSKSTVDLTSTQGGTDGPSQETDLGHRPSSTSRQLVRRRSVPLVGPSADAEFVTDGRGGVLFASSNR